VQRDSPLQVLCQITQGTLCSCSTGLNHASWPQYVSWMVAALLLCRTIRAKLAGGRSRSRKRGLSLQSIGDAVRYAVTIHFTLLNPPQRTRARQRHARRKEHGQQGSRLRSLTRNPLHQAVTSLGDSCHIFIICLHVLHEKFRLCECITALHQRSHLAEIVGTVFC